MRHIMEPKDLVVLVADSQQEKAIETLLNMRAQALGLRQPAFEIYPHTGHDPGVYTYAGEFLSIFIRQFNYALVLLDAAWEGSPGANEIAAKVQSDLDGNGWRNRSAVIVVDPELEIWVWSDSPHVPQMLDSDWATIRAFAQAQGYWNAGLAKPTQPKALLDDLLYHANRHRSSALFTQLARVVSVERCQDPSFARFRSVLQEWFPLHPPRVLRERTPSKAHWAKKRSTN